MEAWTTEQRRLYNGLLARGLSPIDARDVIILFGMNGIASERRLYEILAYGDANTTLTTAGVRPFLAARLVYHYGPGAWNVTTLESVVKLIPTIYAAPLAVIGLIGFKLGPPGSVMLGVGVTIVFVLYIWIYIHHVPRCTEGCTVSGWQCLIWYQCCRWTRTTFFIRTCRVDTYSRDSEGRPTTVLIRYGAEICLLLPLTLFVVGLVFAMPFQSSRYPNASHVSLLTTTVAFWLLVTLLGIKVGGLLALLVYTLLNARLGKAARLTSFVARWTLLINDIPNQIDEEPLANNLEV